MAITGGFWVAAGVWFVDAVGKRPLTERYSAHTGVTTESNLDAAERALPLPAMDSLSGYTWGTRSIPMSCYFGSQFCALYASIHW